MKFSIIAALVVVLALAQGSQSAEPALTVEQLRQHMETIKASIMDTTQKLTEQIQAQDLAAQAQAHLEPLTSQIKDFTSDLEGKLTPLASDIKDKVQPMINNFQDEMQSLITRLLEQAKAIGQ